MQEIQVTARFSIHEGGLEEFKALAAEAVQAVRDQDTGTHQYDWFFSANLSECVVRERYADSQAVLDHIGHLGETLPALVGVADLALEIYGDPSPELLEASAGLEPEVFSHFLSP